MTHAHPTVADKPLEPLWSRPYVVILLGIFLVNLITSMYNIGMTYFADLIHGGLEYAGVSAGVFSLSSLAIKPVAARLSNRFDDGVLMAVTSALIGIAAFCHQFVDTIAVLAVARVFHGVLYGVFATASGAAINSILPRSRLSEGLGFFAVVSMVVPAVGPSVLLSIITEGDLSSFAGLFSFSLGLGLVAALVTLVGVPCFGKANPLRKVFEKLPDGSTEREPVEVAQMHKGRPANELPKTYFGLELKTLLPAAILCPFCFAFSSVNFYLPIYAFDVGLTEMRPVYVIFAAMALSCRFFLGRNPEKVGPNKYLIVGMMCLAVSYSLIPLCPNALCLYLTAFPLGIGMGLVPPLLNYYIVKRCSPERPGSASAAYFIAYDIGYSSGAFAFGMIVASWGYPAAFLGSGAVCVSGLLLFLLTLARPAKRH